MDEIILLIIASVYVIYDFSHTWSASDCRRHWIQRSQIFHDLRNYEITIYSHPCLQFFNNLFPAFQINIIRVIFSSFKKNLIILNIVSFFLYSPSLSLCSFFFFCFSYYLSVLLNGPFIKCYVSFSLSLFNHLLRLLFILSLSSSYSIVFYLSFPSFSICAS